MSAIYIQLLFDLIIEVMWGSPLSGAYDKSIKGVKYLKVTVFISIQVH